MDYNSTRPKLILSEYGRNVQNMVNHIMTLPTKEERNKYAQAVIELMGHLNPHLRDVADFKHKLWDHLFIISEFKLDVDSPYPIPVAESFQTKPEPLKYPANRIKYKHYGKTVELLVEKLKTEQDPEKREAFIASIANFMKIAYVNWNKDHVNDDTIISDLRIYLGRDIAISDGLSLNRVDAPRSNNNNNNRNKHHKNGKQNNKNKKKRY